MKLIINADDFGYSSDANKAIVKTLTNGLVSSTSIMANMPGFEEAVSLIKTKKMINQVGIHLNLFEGKPLTKEMQKCRVFCNDEGIFYYHSRKIKRFDTLKIPAAIIFNELSAQIEKVLNAGIIPTHLDSHGNIHTNYFIGSILIKLAKQYNIPSIRKTSNLLKRNNIFSKMMVILYNLRLQWHGFKSVNYSGTISDVTSNLNNLTGTVEVIVHPVYNNGMLFDSEEKVEFTQLVAPFQEIEKISYAEL